jgi:hypothetical protein
MRGGALTPTERALAAARGWLDGPQPIERLALLRMVVPLATLGFLSSRLVHADFWLSPRAFAVPCLGGHDWRQVICLPAIPVWAAWGVAAVTAGAGLCLALGLRTPIAALVFACAVAYLVLADRLEAFTVTKIAPALAFALFVSPSGARYSVDAWLARRRAPNAEPPTAVHGGVIRFFQLFLVVMYSGAGLSKLRRGWLSENVLWSHAHDNYQTWIAWLLVRSLPGGAWQGLQYLTLAFEVGAPLWFALRATRTPALVVGLGMHLMIGLMFGPVVWFAILMAGLLAASFAPASWLRAVARWGAGLTPSRPRPGR